MGKLKRLLLTDDLLSGILLVQRAAALADEGRVDWIQSDLARVELADAIVAAFTEQSADRTRRLPERATGLAPVVEVRLTPKRRRRA